MRYEMRTGNLSDMERLKLLWADVFGDEIAAINRFFESMFAIDRVFVAVDNGLPIAMLFLLPAKLSFGQQSYDAGYIYAVATDKNFRGQGIMKELEAFACDNAAVLGMTAVALVPQSSSLFRMYQKLGYQTAFYQTHTVLAPSFHEDGELVCCTEACFLERRAKLLTEKAAAFDFARDGQSFRYEEWKANDGEILLYQDATHCGYLVGKKIGRQYQIQESDLPLSALTKAAYALTQKYYRLERVTAVGAGGRRTPYGMIKSLCKELNGYDFAKLSPMMNLMLE